VSSVVGRRLTTETDNTRSIGVECREETYRDRN